MESTKTVVLYMLNLISMVLMSILIVGILIISFIIYLEGSLSVDPIIFVHLTIPAFVLVLNLYVITLEDKEEEKFFKSSKKSGVGKGVFLVNFALVGSAAALLVAAYVKFIAGPSTTALAPPINEDDLYGEGDDSGFMGGASQDTVVFIEECLMHALAVIESVTLREYAKAKLKDLKRK